MCYFSAYPDILIDMMSRMGPKVGLVQGLPFCTDRKGFPAVLDKVKPFFFLKSTRIDHVAVQK